jgi:carbon monoxide dehydrogenase subunit G
MKIEGQHLFAATPELVWDAVIDPDVLAKVLPGCEDFHAVGDGNVQGKEFEGKLKIKVGPVQGDFMGNVLLTELEPPRSYRLKLKGKGAPGFVEGDGTVELVPDAGGTLLKYSVEAKIGGRIATVGQRLLDSSSKVITRQALEGLEGQIGARIATHEAGVAARAAAVAEEEAAAALAAAQIRQAAEEAGTADAEAVARQAAEQAAAEAAASQAAAARAAAAAKAAEAEAAREKAANVPSQSEFAATVAKEVAKDLIPMPARVVFFVLALVALVFIIRAC